MAKRPRIGVTGPDKGGTAAWLFTALSVWLAGGIPIRITPSEPRTTDRLDGLIVGGGADVDPQAYQEEDFISTYLDQTLYDTRKSLFSRISRFYHTLMIPVVYLIRKLFSRKSHRLDKERDKLEFYLVDEAVKKHLPLLGICRGAQLMNVYFKGDLHQDINPFYFEEPNRASVFPIKQVELERDSKLALILIKDRLLVNALHQQAVHRPGENIRIVGREPNGVVQAIESTALPFAIGVQWHPEYLVNEAMHRRIFKALVKEAKREMQK